MLWPVRARCPAHFVTLDTLHVSRCEPSINCAISVGLQVRYVSRKRLAESRPRVRGQFVKAEVAAACRALAAVQVLLNSKPNTKSGHNFFPLLRASCHVLDIERA
jgi:CCT motif